MAATNTSLALLLEDEPLISMDIEMTLEAAGFTVKTVMSRAEAHAWLDAMIPDIVIVDIELADGSSTDIVARLVDADIPFVVHSGDHPSTCVGTPFQHGAWISKPASAEALVLAARSAIGG